jgi:hypothetical protein
VAGGDDMSRRQGDQIGQIFAYKVIVYLGRFFNITKEASILSVLISMEKVMYYFLTRNWMG